MDLNSTQAAIRAGYSAKTAREMGYENLKKPHIQGQIALGRQRLQQHMQITQERVIAEMAVVAFSNIWDYTIDARGQVVLTDQAAPGAQRAVASMKRRVTFSEHGETVETEVKLWNKTQALEQLGKHLGLFRDPVAQDNAAFMQGLIAVMQRHIGEGSAAKRAIFGYLEEYLGTPTALGLVRQPDGSYSASDSGEPAPDSGPGT